jgi:hypothetical protein
MPQAILTEVPDESDRKNHGACGHGKCDNVKETKINYKIKILHKGLCLLTCTAG